jgi:hypothetical protein
MLANHREDTVQGTINLGPINLRFDSSIPQTTC